MQTLRWFSPFSILCYAIILPLLVFSITEAVTNNHTLCNIADLCPASTLSQQLIWFSCIFGFLILLFLILPPVACKLRFIKVVDRLWTYMLDNVLRYRGSWGKVFWTMTHFATYFMLGMVSPCYWKESLLLSTVWEWIECVGISCLVLKDLCQVDRSKCTDSVVCAGTSDLLANALGLTVGCLIARYITLPAQ